MDEEATQQATQPFLDPRRQGDKSMLSEEDEADVLCILHPSSPAAYQAVKLVAATAPQHILQNDGMPHTLRGGDDSLLEESNGPQAVSKPGGEIIDLDRTQECSGTSGPTLEIALRLSSNLKDPCLGFTFGRLTKRCDLVISESNMNPISGMHFRIFINQHGVPMIEDTSTNGTLVEGKLLQASGKDPGTEKRRMLTGGCIIQVLCHDSANNEIKFIVKFPERTRARKQWQNKLREYMAYVVQLERGAAFRNEAAQKGAVMDLAPVSTSSKLTAYIGIHFGNSSLPPTP